MTPFGVTAQWLGAYFRTESKEAATRSCRISGKQFARALIESHSPTSRIHTILTIPVEGGASVLKNRGTNPILSEHGKWRREHLGAWHAAYGRTPFFEHLMPEIERVYRDSTGITLEEFNSGLLNVALGWIDKSVVCSEEFELVKEEIVIKIKPELSIFDALFRLGKETAFGIFIN